MSWERYTPVRGGLRRLRGNGVWIGLRKQGKAGLRLVILLRCDVLSAAGLRQGQGVTLYLGRGPDVHLLGIGAPVAAGPNLVLRKRAPRAEDCELHAPAVAVSTARVSRELEQLPDKAWRFDAATGMLLVRRPSWLPPLPGYELSGDA